MLINKTILLPLIDNTNNEPLSFYGYSLPKPLHVEIKNTYNNHPESIQRADQLE